MNIIVLCQEMKGYYNMVTVCFVTNKRSNKQDRNKILPVFLKFIAYFCIYLQTGVILYQIAKARKKYMNNIKNHFQFMYPAVCHILSVQEREISIHFRLHALFYSKKENYFLYLVNI